MNKIFTVLVMLSACGLLHAQTPMYSFGANTGSNSIPMSTGVAGGSTRCQFIYQAGDFGTVPAGMAISTIYLRVGAATGASSYTNFQVDIGQSNVTTLAGTAWETGLTTGLNTPTLNVPAVIVDQWVPFTLTTPIPYDPALTLVIDLRYSAFTGGFNIHTQSLTAGRRQYANYATAAPTANSPQKHDFGFDLVPVNRAVDDAGINALVAPANFCSGLEDVKVNLVNFGRNAINSVTVNWELDGFTQTPVQWSSTIDTPGSVAGNDTTITLGSVFFAPNTARTIRVWTSFPNNNTDTVPGNDTLLATLKAGLSGIYTIGGVSPDYPNFTSAVSDLNKYGICGPVTFNVPAGTTFTENPIILTRTGTPVNPITFQKSGTGANPIVYGKGGTGTLDAVIAIAGASYITFNGIDVADSVSNTTAAARMEYGYGIVNGSATAGSNNNVISNCRVTLNRANTASIGVVQSTLSVATSLVGGNHNNRYENIRVENSYNGIALLGTPAFPDSNNVITSSAGDTTIIGGINAGDIGGATVVVSGINVSDQRNVEVSGCLVRNLAYTSTSVSQGIWLNNVTATTDYGTARIFNNTVHNINRITTTSATGTIIGIRVELATLAKARVYNNLVYGIESVSFPATATANQTIRGISYGNSTGTGYAEFYHNTVSINSATTNVSSSAFWKGAGVSATVLRNNIFSNTTVAQTTSKHYAVFFTAGGSLISSNNVLWVNNANGFIGNAAGADRSTLAVFAAASSAAAPSDGNEQGSAFADPGFVSAGNFMFAANTPAALNGANLSSIIAIATDRNGNTRNTNNPTIGAYETNNGILDSSAPVISNVTIENGTFPVVRATITDAAIQATMGNVQLWYRSGTSGAFTALAPDSLPVGGNGTYKWDVAFNALTLGNYQFYIAARDQVGPGINIAFNPIQGTAITGFNPSDPANYLANPDAGVNTRTFRKLNALAGGVYSVGATGNYLKLTDVANALNNNVITGDVTFELYNDYDGTSGETFPITFNEITSSGGSWTATIRPALGVTARETSGIPASGVQVISLNGTRNLTLDGRPGGTGTTGQWTIRNKSTTATIASAVIMINGAQHNTLNYLNIQSASTLGTVLFSTSTGAGNKYNLISNCTIRDRSDATGIPTLAIASTGTATAVNDSNSIIGNNIFNYSSMGVSVTNTGNGNRWIVDGNSFYNNLAPTTAQTSISIIAAASSGHLITNNYIGGSQPLCGGTAWTHGASAQWRGIVITALAGTDSVYITGNTIQNIYCTTGTVALWCAELTSGTISISNNLFGHPTTPNSIRSNMNALFTGLYLQTGNFSVYNNTFANMTSTSTASTLGMTGIQSTGTGNLLIRDNLFHAFSASSVATSATASSVRAMLSSGAANHVITGNTISNLLCTGGPTGATATGAQGFVITSGSGIISNNKIYGLNNTSSNASAQINAINLSGSSWTVYNNMISLGYNVDSSALINGMLIATTGATKIYHNSVSISGAATGVATSQASAALRRTGTATTDLKNNILNNTRSGGAANYAVANTNATPATGWAANYNNLYTANSAQLGLWAAATQDFAAWKTVSLNDAASINTAPGFISASDLHLTNPTLGDVTYAGTPLAGFANDIDGDLRHATAPYMGADESLSFPLPVKLLHLTAHKKGEDVLLTWATATERNSSHFEVERSVDARNFEAISNVPASGKINGATYNYYDHSAPLNNADVVYYRLKMVDLDGHVDYSPVVNISNERLQLTNTTIYPNPFTQELYISLSATAASQAHITVTDLTGKTTATLTRNLEGGQNTWLLDELTKLTPGLYFLSIESGSEKQVLKLIKQ